MGQGAYIFGCSGTVLQSKEIAFFNESDPWGFILFARNVESPVQLRKLTNDLRSSVGRDAPILIDQEGGRVARLTQPHWRQWQAPLDQVASYPDQAERSMYLRYRVIAAELRDVGVDVNCVPCADIAFPDTHPVLHNRCYGSDAETVVRVSRHVANASLDGGVLPVVKHIPGHGRATLDSHVDLPRVGAGLSELEETDFSTFRQLSDLPLGMSAHVVYDALDKDPATTSKVMINRIRDDIGFDGLLMTDDISMQALSGDVKSRTQASLRAGCDLILHCNGERAEMEQIADTAGHLAQSAQKRADAAILARKTPKPFDITAAEAELESLLGERING
ncbi:glycoside hydrolase family 3 N-terminal domain-containing protein [Pseudohalocynthiibacter aestuariivivens]|jgi:beta-N-acetylhexosaminidase|uniref:beta-N-acetylhexosaminidase n=1 Tax=Pseudohalocynthiibacter aestuariivivens TaxID=1591409 RepID=A0ABV5JFS4_9RHOB|nr:MULTISPECIES: glycoside hydrolase family 3 protein [Pseudohalocynthiibacter]MBS9716360.1 glycoside hydrolase family 3 protein [Pseudohalocynthiibacter aestuariivivens]MCK0100831.1 glycoside hydrolase family 3 protein [Pseudohalocynthiibacter sp. F2068]